MPQRCLCELVVTFHKSDGRSMKAVAMHSAASCYADCIILSNYTVPIEILDLVSGPSVKSFHGKTHSTQHATPNPQQSIHSA